MTEFLTENAYIRYPLAGEWPDGLSGYDGLLLDASIGCNDEEPPEKRVRVLCFRKNEASDSTFDMIVGTEADADGNLVVRIDGAASGERTTVFARNERYKLFAVIGVKTAHILCSRLPKGQTDVGIPFDVRCISVPNRRVSSLSAYASALCETPVFTGSESPVSTVTEGGVTVAAKDGVDVESVSLPEFSENVLRISALSSPNQYDGSDSDSDIILTGDDCFTVETLPGVKVDAAGDIVRRTEEDPGGINGGGVIKIGTKCKSCCQCEDYEQAFNSLKPANEGVMTVKEMLDKAKSLYEKAVAAFNEEKRKAEEFVNSYENVHMTATGTASGHLYADAKTASGLRKRVAVTVTAANMTLKDVQVKADADTMISVPGFSLLSVAWHTGGSKSLSGSTIASYDPTWILHPGDTVVIVGTYAQTGNTNDAVVPHGSKASLTFVISGLDPKTLEVDVK